MDTALPPFSALPLYDGDWPVGGLWIFDRILARDWSQCGHLRIGSVGLGDEMALRQRNLRILTSARDCPTGISLLGTPGTEGIDTLWPGLSLPTKEAL